MNKRVHLGLKNDEGQTTALCYKYKFKIHRIATYTIYEADVTCDRCLSILNGRKMQPRRKQRCSASSKSFWGPTSLWLELEDTAKKLGRTASDITRTAVRDFLDEVKGA